MVPISPVEKKFNDRIACFPEERWPKPYVNRWMQIKNVVSYSILILLYWNCLSACARHEFILLQAQWLRFSIATQYVHYHHIKFVVTIEHTGISFSYVVCLQNDTNLDENNVEEKF